VEQQRYLRCLGQPALFAPTGELIRFRTKKHLALLIYLAVENRSHRRDRLAEFLWPKVSTAEARHSLATALSTIRPRLGPDGIESSRDHARLAPGRVTLDLERLEAGDVLGTEVTGSLEVAAFLDGFDIPDSAEFTHWKDRQQARLLPLIKDALLALVDRCRRTGDTRQIEKLADRMLALDYLSEEAVRAKMEARAFAGDRLTALEIFEDWKIRLNTELQASPSELVEGMAVRLRRRGWERTILPTIPNVPTDHWKGRPFIGRNIEYRILYEAWEDVRKGIPRNVLVLGDSGVGKSTLVNRLTTAAGLQGATISRVQCYDLEREIPYSMLSGLVLGFLDSSGVSATSPESLSELARIIPEVRRRYPNIPVSDESQGEIARIRLTEAFCEMLAAIAEEHSIILVVDDLHLTDDVSLAVLHLVMRRVRNKPVMIVFIARPGEMQQAPHAARLRESTIALGIQEIRVPPLDEEDSREILMSLVGSDGQRPSLQVERALLRASAGFPMMLELLVHDWQISGEQSLALAIDSMSETPLHGASVPYQQILDRITKHLSATTHNVLNLASLLGQRLNDLGMYALVDLSVGQTVAAMSELVSRRVLRDGGKGLEFVNELVRAAAYVGVPLTLRKILHGKIADSFIREHQGGNGTLGLEIAWHCVRAGRHEEATYHLMQGAREALRRGAVHAAERALSTAVHHLGASERFVASVLLAEVLQEQGRWRDSLDTLFAYQGQSSEILLILTVTAQFWETPRSREQILVYVSQLRPVLDGAHDVQIRLKAANISTSMVTSLREIPLAMELLAAVNRIPTELLKLDDLASLAECKARLLYTALERAPCLKEITASAAELQSKAHASSTMGRLHTGLGAVACCEGRYEDAKTQIQRAYDVFVGLGNETYSGSAAAQMALCCMRLGQYSESIGWGNCAVQTFGSHFSGYKECLAALCLGCSYALTNDLKRAEEIISALDFRFPTSAPPWMLQAWGFYKADILFLVGQYSRATSSALQVLGQPPQLYSCFFAGAFSRWLALTAGPSPQERRSRGGYIASLLNEIEKYDALDQAEMLCASLSLEGLPEDALYRTHLLETKLSNLPGAVSEQLRRLGMYPFMSTGAGTRYL
jgi:DNA-binding SARP family transcriptional activator/tetratricopeptide (TPR) repeat protein